MTVYYPFGQPIIPTPEQGEQEERKFALYDTYGIPYGIFDGEQYLTQKDKDRSKAMLLIMQGKDLPEELKKKLLKYKKADEIQLCK